MEVTKGIFPTNQSALGQPKIGDRVRYAFNKSGTTAGTKWEGKATKTVADDAETNRKKDVSLFEAITDAGKISLQPFFGSILSDRPKEGKKPVTKKPAMSFSIVPLFLLGAGFFLLTKKGK